MVTSQLLSSIPGIRHAFGSAAELVPAALAPVWPRRPAKRQVHGTRVAAITDAQSTTTARTTLIAHPVYRVQRASETMRRNTM